MAQLAVAGQPPMSVHMFWQPDMSDRDKERQHKRSPSASNSHGGSHSASAASSRSSSVSRHDGHNMGYGMGFNPSPQTQAVSLFDPSTIRPGGASRQSGPPGSTSLEATFASIMGQVEENDSDEDDDDDEDGADALTNALAMGMMGIGMSSAPSQSGSVNVITPSSSGGPMSVPMTRESSMSNASVHSGVSNSGRDKMHLNTNIWVPSAPSASATTPKAARRAGAERDREHREHHREHRDYNNATGTSHSRSALTTSNSNASSSLSLMLAPSMALTVPPASARASSSSSSSMSSALSLTSSVNTVANASVAQDSFYAVAERARDERLRVRRGEFQSRAEVVAAFQRRVEDLMAEFAAALVRVDEYERFGSPPSRT